MNWLKPADRVTVLLMGGDLKPWRRIRARCEHCDQPAAHVVDVMDEPTIEPGVIYLGGMTGQARELVCSDHLDARMDALTREFGGANGAPVRESWPTWFLMHPPVRWWDRWWNAVEFAWPEAEAPVQRLLPFRWAWMSDDKRIGATFTRWGAKRRQKNPRGGWQLYGTSLD